MTGDEMMDDVTIRCTGDTVVSVTFPGGISVANNLRVRALEYAVKSNNIPGIVELVPTYCSLMIHYDPMRTAFDSLKFSIGVALSSLGDTKLPAGTVTEIPVLYGGECGPDLAEVAAYEHISEDEVIRLHSEQESFIFMIAFTPGLPYIGSPRKTFSVPRRNSPRVKLPVGSVTIWESQTTVFPVEQPGGWNVIGRTPIRLFDKSRADSPFVLQSGHWVKFRPVNTDEYEQIKASVDDGTYKLITYEKRGTSWE